MLQTPESPSSELSLGTRVFITYSWDDDRHKEWVCDLATRLKAELGLDVRLDAWLLSGGVDRHFFMEDGIVNSQFVLMIYTPDYKRKIDLGRGGVSQEADLIRTVLEQDTNRMQRKFVPLLRKGSWEGSAPIWFARLAGYDLTQDPHDKSGWTKLCQHIQSSYAKGSTSFRSTAAPHSSDLTVVWPDPVPEHVWDLVDRKRETSRLADLLSGQSSTRIFLIRGRSQMGKSYLLERVEEYLRKVKVAFSRSECRNLSKLDDLFRDLFVAMPNVFLPATKNERAKRDEAVLRDLRELKVPVLLMLDDYEKGPRCMKEWVESKLLPSMGYLNALAVTIAGESVPEHEGKPWRHLTECLDLHAIRDADEWYQHSQRHKTGATFEFIENLTWFTDGIPGRIAMVLEKPQSSEGFRTEGPRREVLSVSAPAITRSLQAVQSDPKKLDLVLLDVALGSRDPSVRDVIEAAAVPHWFTESILARLLGTVEIDERCQGVERLPKVERFAARDGWSVHENTRRALRQRLAIKSPERLQELSKRAIQCFEGEEAHLCIERVFHKLVAVPDEGQKELSTLWRDWVDAGLHEPLRALSVVVEELVQTTPLNPVAEARVLLCSADPRWLPLAQCEYRARQSFHLFRHCRDRAGQASAHTLLGDLLSERGLRQDALAEYHEGEKIRSELVTEDPGDLEKRRSLAVLYHRIGRIYERSPDSSKSALEQFKKS